jgi:hypothetical protein
MNMADGIPDTADAAVAEVIAAAVQLPVFLVYASGTDGLGQWQEAAYAAVAKHWHANAGAEWAGIRTVEFIAAMANVITTALNTSMAKTPATCNSAQPWQARSDAWGEERHRIWCAQCELLLDWLRSATPAHVAKLADLWFEQGNEAASLLAAHPLLMRVRDRLHAFTSTAP